MAYYLFSIYMHSEEVRMKDGNTCSDGDGNCIRISQKVSGAPHTELEEFMYMYGDGQKPTVFENSFEMPAKLFALDVRGDLMEPTKEMLEAYEAGKKSMYLVSYEMDVSRVQDLDEDEMENLLNETEAA